MSWPTLNYNNWQFWSVYDPPLYLGEQKVTFFGPERLIVVNEGVTTLSFREDVYSAWKEWQADPNQNNTKYAVAVSAVGGDKLPGDRVLGITYFLENGWRMRTWEGNHQLTVNGNFFTREGVPAFVSTINPWTTTINLNTSALVEAIQPTFNLTSADVEVLVNGIWNNTIQDADSALDILNSLITDISAIPDNVWDEIIDATKNQTAREKLRRIATKTQDIALR
jgi:hypothetical protein